MTRLTSCLSRFSLCTSSIRNSLSLGMLLMNRERRRTAVGTSALLYCMYSKWSGDVRALQQAEGCVVSSRLVVTCCCMRPIIADRTHHSSPPILALSSPPPAAVTAGDKSMLSSASWMLRCISACCTHRSDGRRSLLPCRASGGQAQPSVAHCAMMQVAACRQA